MCHSGITVKSVAPSLLQLLVSSGLAGLYIGYRRMNVTVLVLQMSSEIQTTSRARHIGDISTKKHHFAYGPLIVVR